MTDPVLSRLHQLTVDTYGAQHSSAAVPAITTAFALVGLHLALEHGASGLEVRTAHKWLADHRSSWPRFPGPVVDDWSMTILDVALANSPQAHDTAVHAWARAVWDAWRDHHTAIAALARTGRTDEVSGRVLPGR
jgi:Family of unknown function (DUF5946)